MVVCSAELGDYNPEDHTPGYLSEFRFITNQTEDFEHDVCQLHKQHRSVGQSRAHTLAQLGTHALGIGHTSSKSRAQMFAEAGTPACTSEVCINIV